MSLRANKKHIICVAVLTVLSFCLRLYGLGGFPPLDVDEYGIAYNAFSIVKTGMDEWGFTVPLFFRSFGDYKLPVDIYSAALFFKLFSPSVFWLRMPAVIAATLYTPLIYLFLRLYVKNQKLVYLGTILSIVSPLNMFFSHMISGSITQSVCTFASVVSFAYFIAYGKQRTLILSVLAISISLYAYPSSWFVAPLLVIMYAVILLLQKKYRSLPILLFFFIAFLPIMWQFFLGGSTIRLAHTSFIGESSGAVIEINEFRQHAGNDLLSKLLHNKGTYSLYTLTRNYIQHFDPQFLFISPVRKTIQSHLYAPLFLVLLPFYYMGLITIVKKYKNPLFLLLASWILIAPLPSAITEGDVNSKRYLSFLGSELVVSMIGMYAVRIYTHKKLYIGILCLLFLQIVHFLSFFFVVYPPLSQEFTHYKGNLLAQVIRNQYAAVDTITYSSSELGEPQIFPLFALRYPPEKYIDQKKFDYHNWYYIRPFDKFYYADNLKTIENYIHTNVRTKKILGFFSSEELHDLSAVCYEERKTYPGVSHGVFHEVIFIPCSQK